MKIAVVTEVSTRARNQAVMEALSGRGHEVFNAGMSDADTPELTYLNTGLMAGLLLNAKACDLVVGGCGTGQGFLISAMQYPSVSCGLILEPLDGWLFARINDGNCISLALNKGFGWAGEIGLRQIFDEYFASERGSGFPETRKQSQGESRMRLGAVSEATHLPMKEILTRLPIEMVAPVAKFPGFIDLLREQGSDRELIDALWSRR